MVDTTYLLLALIIVFDFVLSLWNAYSSGVIWGLLRSQPGKTFSKVSAFAGLGLAFAGMAYATTIILAWVAWQIGFLAIWDFLYLVSFDFLVFGAMIIGFGLVVTVQSITIAYRQRNFGSIAIATWNTFAEVWDIATYAQGFQTAASVMKGDRRDRSNVTAILLVAVAIALIITYFAFRQGLQKASGAIAQSPRQEAADEAGPAGAEAGHHRSIRRAVVAGVVVLVVVVAGILAFHFLPPSPQVNVSEIDVYAPSDVCGLNTHPVSYSGFTDMPGVSESFQLQVVNFNITACTVHGASTNTTGFSLSGIEVPLTIQAGQNQYLNLTINLPSNAYSGPLNVIYM
ncbi:MAG TPA: hypothetical protein VEY07_06615 [Thermoplasmata archaeon]|nr:hypothetical protein [Thermoplasmata archaeon]